MYYITPSLRSPNMPYPAPTTTHGAYPTTTTNGSHIRRIITSKNNNNPSQCTCPIHPRPDDWGFDTPLPPPAKMDAREQLRQHFLSLPPDQQVHGWDAMWQQKITPWDQDKPNPALVEALEKKAYLTAEPFVKGAGQKRKKVLVPGCGGGYDVNLFASYGFDAYGLDASPTALEKAESHLRDQGKEQTYRLQNIQHGRGRSAFILADFFADDWLEETHEERKEHGERKFDLIYDYTFLCALPPPLRPKWAKRMSELLKPDGYLICTMYPLGKDPRLGGPPFGLSHPLYEQLLNKPGWAVNYDLNGKVVEDRSGETTAEALEEVESWIPDAVFEPQRGKVMVSVWRHKQAGKKR